ncbi:hypothetical protein B0P06_004292 [Clostridium saccharoperbutylacetonicum]|uniref:Uncharacterized protein n=1 Tax=Clostridium saccharoperbutylacetonicum N1-4(HMT) TaxID=931276 RepID=M1N1P8_9CLOT|nr:hypothetical protein [Clostridium saccharoperbutylacetonicum]AGF57412.1 hypothetical protein Cspa_c36520 [Clostridium saccharoperbutylacetonicum N1-4(HMT)]NRT61824.1 hypothetical protein [Clostridium saccharoperbutylacetonicum]NSB25150.1 hypothetical protein [Clostridium saccharoperbutylacetonicum]NSB44521.1 hypothetical protein [Clostridium saccharoperbutylacetonicum]
MSNDWSFVVSVVSALGAVCSAAVAFVALMNTRKQINLSNKQILFDKRMENYIIAKGLIQLYRENCEHIKNEKYESMFPNDFYFMFLTNNTYLEQIAYAINNPLKEPSHKELLIKLENLKDVATKIKFLFSGNASTLLESFVLSYKEVLHAMYKYQIVLNDMEQENKNHKLTFEESSQLFGEKAQRVKIKKAFDNLKQADSALIKENAEEQIEEQIRLY